MHVRMLLIGVVVAAINKVNHRDQNLLDAGTPQTADVHAWHRIHRRKVAPREASEDLESLVLIWWVFVWHQARSIQYLQQAFRVHFF